MGELVGRDAELKILRKVQNSQEPELLAVYGRRRVGKTFLVRQFFGPQLKLDYSGALGATVPEQLANFAIAMHKGLDLPVPPAVPRSWQEAFQQLEVLLGALPKTKKWQSSWTNFRGWRHRSRDFCRHWIIFGTRGR